LAWRKPDDKASLGIEEVLVETAPLGAEEAEVEEEEEGEAEADGGER